MSVTGEFYAKDATPPHHVYWNKALQDAVEKTKQRKGVTHTYKVTFEIDVVRTNPGWINRYAVTLT